MLTTTELRTTANDLAALIGGGWVGRIAALCITLLELAPMVRAVATPIKGDPNGPKADPAPALILAVEAPSPSTVTPSQPIEQESGPVVEVAPTLDPAAAILDLTEGLTLAELRRVARGRVRGFMRMRKHELRAALAAA